MKVRINVSRREGIADPEGSTTATALRSLGFEEVGAVSMGRSIMVDVEAESADSARARVEEMCRQLLTNPVIEDFDIEVLA